MVYLIYGAHATAEDFFEFSPAFDIALSEAKMSRESAVALLELAGAQYYLGFDFEKRIQQIGPSRLPFYSFLRPRLLHFLTVQWNIFYARKFLLGWVPFTKYVDADGGFYRAALTYLATRHIRTLFENMSFDSWTHAYAERLHYDDLRTRAERGHTALYLHFLLEHVTRTIRTLLIRDMNFARLVKRVARNKAVCPIIVRGAVHFASLNRALENQEISTKILHMPEISMFYPYHEIIVRRILRGIYDGPFTEKESLLAMQNCIMGRYEDIVGKCVMQRRRAPTYEIFRLSRNIVDRWNIRELDEYLDSGSREREKLLYHRTVEKSTDAEKEVLRDFIDFGARMYGTVR